jgi:hypothetical protein
MVLLGEAPVFHDPIPWFSNVLPSPIKKGLKKNVFRKPYQ